MQPGLPGHPGWYGGDIRPRYHNFHPADRFVPPREDDTPRSLFTLGNTGNINGARFSRFSDGRQILVYTDGSCLRNGQDSAVGGCAFVFNGFQAGVSSFRLENRGPFGDYYRHTSNRAELRAVLAALRFYVWNWPVSCTELVIATDSRYVALGATEWVAGWVASGWISANGGEVLNQDLWIPLFKEIRQLREQRLLVRFWQIPREWNTAADRAAREAAERRAPMENFTEI